MDFPHLLGRLKRFQASAAPTQLAGGLQLALDCTPLLITLATGGTPISLQPLPGRSWIIIRNNSNAQVLRQDDNVGHAYYRNRQDEIGKRSRKRLRG